MKTCPHCQIKVGGSSTYCPLCQNRLTGTEESPWWPVIIPPLRRASLVFKIVAFLALAGNVVAAAFDFLLEEGEHTHWSLLMLAWVLAGLLVLHMLLRRRYNGPRLVFQLLLIVSGMIIFTDWFNGYTGYSLDLVVPVLCSITLVCNCIFAFLRTRFTENALVYLLLNIGVGVLPYLLLVFRVGTGSIDGHSIPWVICLMISAITFLGLFIFQGRALRSEIEKRLHM